MGRVETVTEDRDATVTTDDLLTSTYAYDLLGNLDRMVAANGIISDYTYDSLNRLDTQTDYLDDGTVNGTYDDGSDTLIAKYDYTVRNDGKRTGLSEEFGNGVSNDYTWEYDNLGRLVSETVDSSDNTIDEKTTSDYDLTGNRTQFTRDIGNDGSVEETVANTHDANDRLLQEVFTSGADTKTTAYGYDHTQQTSKLVTNADSTSTSTAFTYDLQGRMLTATITTKDALGTATRIEKKTYDYDTMGIRISAVQEIDTDANGTFDQTKTTEFLVDHHNHTGYRQVLRETHFVDGVKTKTVDYSFGHDELTQTTQAYLNGSPDGASVTLVFGHDGHGSVRVLTDILTSSIVQTFMYDAYGQMLAIFNAAGAVVSGGNGAYADTALAQTILLYSGKQFDSRIGQQYLRARYYDATTGTFNRLDPFFGYLHDPQSFHKYLYTQADPIQGTDPTGLVKDRDRWHGKCHKWPPASDKRWRWRVSIGVRD